MAGWLLLLVGVPLTGLGVALWCRRTWARWPSVALLLLLASGQCWGLATKGMTSGRVTILAGFLMSAWFVYREFSPTALAALEDPGTSGSEANRPLISLVLLLRKPRHLEAGMLARYCEAAWGGVFKALRDDQHPRSIAAEPGVDGWVGGRSPFLFVGSPTGVFLVHNHDRPYFDETNALAEGASDLQMRQALDENRGWLAVDFMHGENPAADPVSFYPQLARLIAELAGPDCQALFQPEQSRFNHWDETLEARLRAGTLAEILVGRPVDRAADPSP